MWPKKSDQIFFYVPIDAKMFWNVCNNKFKFFQFFVQQNFNLKFLRLCKPDSETLTVKQVILDNQLARGIQSKIVQGLMAEHPWRAKHPHEPGNLGKPNREFGEKKVFFLNYFFGQMLLFIWNICKENIIKSRAYIFLLWFWRKLLSTHFRWF